jgi:hypothetical protein
VEKETWEGREECIPRASRRRETHHTANGSLVRLDGAAASAFLNVVPFCALLYVHTARSDPSLRSLMRHWGRR